MHEKKGISRSNLCWLTARRRPRRTHVVLDVCHLYGPCRRRHCHWVGSILNRIPSLLLHLYRQRHPRHPRHRRHSLCHDLRHLHYKKLKVNPQRLSLHHPPPHLVKACSHMSMYAAHGFVCIGPGTRHHHHRHHQTPTTAKKRHQLCRRHLLCI